VVERDFASTDHSGRQSWQQVAVERQAGIVASADGDVPPCRSGVAILDARGLLVENVVVARR
jgi:hypothetical protein